MKFPIIRCVNDTEQFIHCWSSLYVDQDETKYESNIGRLEPEAIKQLFEWKNGGRLSKRKMTSVETNFINRVHELKTFETSYNAEVFLQRFKSAAQSGEFFSFTSVILCDFLSTIRTMMFLRTATGKKYPKLIKIRFRVMFGSTSLSPRVLKVTGQDSG